MFFWGSIANKFRIVSEILRRIRAEEGDYPVLVKINGFDHRRGGMRPPEALEIARLLEASGCSAIEVSSGTVEEGLSIMRGPVFPSEALLASNFRFKSLPAMVKKALAPLLRLAMPSPKPWRGYNLEVTKAIRQAVSIPVIAVGGIHTLEHITSVLDSGTADFLSMPRPFVIEPNIVRKLQEGRQTASRCIECNYCAIMIEEGSLRCLFGKLPAKQHA